MKTMNAVSPPPPGGDKQKHFAEILRITARKRGEMEEHDKKMVWANKGIGGYLAV